MIIKGEIIMEISVCRDDEEKRIDLVDRDIRQFIDDNWDTIESDLVVALKIGITALKTSSTTVDTNYVDKEFQRLSGDFNERFRKFQEEWDTKVTEVFGDDFRKMKDSMDPDKPQTPTGKLMGNFDLKIKEFFKDMNPVDERTPLGLLRIEFNRTLNEVMKELRAKKAAEDVEERTTLKGIRYEDQVFERILDIGSTFRDSVESIGAAKGIGSSMKGDIISEIHGYDGLNIVFEVKDSGTLKITDKYYKTNIQTAMDNRGAKVAVLVSHPSVYPEVKPFFVWKERTVVCRYDPEIEETTVLEIAYQLARDIAIGMVESGPEEFSLSEFEETLKEINVQALNLENIEKKMTRTITNMTDLRDDLNKAKTQIRLNIKDLLDQINPEEDGSEEQNSLLQY